MVKDYVLNINGEDIKFLVYDCVYIEYKGTPSSSHIIDCTLEAVSRGYNYRLEDDYCAVLVGDTLPAGISCVNQGLVTEDIILRDSTGCISADYRIDKASIMNLVYEVVGIDVLKKYIVDGTVCIWDYTPDNYASTDLE